MARKFKNIMEDIAIDFLDKTLENKPYICSCPDCLNAMMAHILSLIAPKYVVSDEDAMKTIIDQTKIERQADIARAVISAIEAVSKEPPHSVKEDKEKTFSMLLDKIYDDRGLDFRHYHRSILQRRVALRMSKNNVKSLSEYLRFLINNPSEYDKLFEVLCINVSEFFRDPEIWDSVRSFLIKIIQLKKEKGEKDLVIWSSACASGEEPYSIAILLKNILYLEGVADFNVQIFATDLDLKALRACDKAVYPKTVLKNVKERDLRMYFKQADGNNWQLKDEIKNMVSFRQLDLISADFVKDTDMIFCRNVFIYFSRSLQDQLLMKYFRSLKVGGYLIMGKTETMWPEAKQIYEEVDFNAHIYQKKDIIP